MRNLPCDSAVWVRATEFSTSGVAPESRSATRPDWVRRSPESTRRPSCSGSPDFSPGISAKVRYAKCAAEDVPLSEGSVSIVWSIATVHHWSDIDAGLREARRVLIPGGRLVAMERSTEPGARGHGSHGWTNEQAAAFADRCCEHGFTDVRLERATIGRRSTVSVVA